MNPRPEIAIIGAGIGGLTCAIALGRAGIAVTVYEQAPVLGEVGAGITLSPNSARVFDHLGLSDALAAHAYVPERQWTQNLMTDAVLIEKERGPDVVRQYGAGYYHIHRADLHAVLVDAAKAIAGNACVQLEKRLTRISGTGPFTLGFADGSTAQPDVLIGADGLKSIVRETLFAPDTPAFTGQVAWRGLVPMDRLPGSVRARPTGIHIGPRRLFMRYPVRGGDLLNYAAFVELDWREEGWTIPSTIAELMGHFEDACEPVKAMIAATPEHELFKWALHARSPLQTWVHGQATLLGDAAHAMLPFMGQGAGTAIEDGMVLARALAQFAPTQALARYEAARRERTTMVQTNSRLLGLKFQGKDPDQFGQGPIQNEETLGLFSYDAVTVAL